MHIDRQGTAMVAAAGALGFACFGAWFGVSEGAMSLTYGLRGAELCFDVVCRAGVLPADLAGGIYGVFAAIAFWIGLGLLAGLVVTAGLRISSGVSAPFLLAMVRALAIGFVLAALGVWMAGKRDGLDLALGFPLALVGGAGAVVASYEGLLGGGALGDGGYVPLPEMRVAGAVDRAAVAELRFVVASGRFDRAGLVVRLAGGGERQVPWSDLTRAIARQLPPGPPHHQALFLDLVRSSGAPLRLLPTSRFDWSRLPGDTIPGDRANFRRLVALARGHNPALAIEPASEPFFAGSSDPPVFGSLREFLAYDHELG